VTWLEPRTPHQPEKLKKVSKNDYVFTPSIFRVNKNCAILSGLFSIECSEFTGGCQNLVQPLRKQGSKEIFESVSCLLNEVRECERGLTGRIAACAYPLKTAPSNGFRSIPCEITCALQLFAYKLHVHGKLVVIA
jgi:hypothetical protein